MTYTLSEIFTSAISVKKSLQQAKKKEKKEEEEGGGGGEAKKETNQSGAIIYPPKKIKAPARQGPLQQQYPSNDGRLRQNLNPVPPPTSC